MKTNVALIKPKIDSDFIKSRPRPPLSLLITSTLLEEAGIDNQVFDLSFENKSICFADFTHAVITTTPLDRWETPYLNYIPICNFITKLKKKYHKLVVIVTGTHGTVTPEELFEDCPEIDYLIRGEPELVVKNFFTSQYINSIEGLFYKKNGKFFDNGIAHVRDLNLLPLPNYKKIDMEVYRYPIIGTGKAFIIETSRGCPYNCTFCLKAMFPKTISYRDVGSLLEELETLISVYGIEIIYFQDLEFTINRKRVENICTMILSRRLTFKWACASRVNDIDDDMLDIMKNAGCKSISFGVESLCQKTLDRIQKKITVWDVTRAQELCRKHGINFNLFVTRYPFESSSDIIETYRNAFKYGIHYTRRPSRILPYPGTQLYEKIFPGQRPSWKHLQKLVKSAEIKMPLTAWLYFLLLRMKLKIRELKC